MDDRARLQSLLTRARTGDPDAIDRLIEEFGPQIRREVECCLRRNPLRLLTGKSDVYQSVIGRFVMLLHRAGHDLDNPEDLKGLLKAMVKNRITDLGRFHGAGRRDYRRTVRPDAGRPVDSISSEQTPSSIASRAELEVEYRKLQQDVLGRLTAESRAVLKYREQGLGWPEIAVKINHGGPEAVRKRSERDLALVRDQVIANSSLETLEALDLSPTATRSNVGTHVGGAKLGPRETFRRFRDRCIRH